MSGTAPRTIRKAPVGERKLGDRPIPRIGPPRIVDEQVQPIPAERLEAARDLILVGDIAFDMANVGLGRLPIEGRDLPAGVLETLADFRTDEAGAASDDRVLFHA